MSAETTNEQLNEISDGAQQNHTDKKADEETPKLNQISAGKLQNDILITLNQKISEYSLAKSHLNSLPPLESYNIARKSPTDSLGSLKAGIDGILHQLGNSEIV